MTFNVNDYDDARNGTGPAVGELAVVPVEEFIAVDEPGAAALVGDTDNVLIPEGGDVMIYGDGGAGKTTLSLDLACHLAAGDRWLDIEISRPARSLLIENEGPRALLRRKLRRKVNGWTGAALTGRISVFEAPWAQFTFATDQWRAALATIVRDGKIDVLIAGPLTRIGMDAAGTLQEVAAFLALVADVRAQSGRALTVILVHHENRAGTVSGAWEGSGDTLLHVEARGNGHTVLHIQKARWSSVHHNTTLKLAWADGEGYKVEGERDYLAEILKLLDDDKPRIVKEIAAPVGKGGIGANVDDIRKLLDDHPELFESITGDAAVALGRRSNAIVWKRTRASESVESVGDFRGGERETDFGLPPLRESDGPSTPARTDEEQTRASESVRSDDDLVERAEDYLERYGEAT